MLIGVDSAVILFWNVHNLEGPEQALAVVSHVRQHNPDVFCLAEVIGAAAYELIAKNFPDHNFYMTYGPESQELLVGVRRTLQALFSQKTEFRSGNAFVRPAALLTLMGSESPLNILFVHPKSLSSPYDFGQRDDFFGRVFSLKSLLDKKAGGNALFLVCGDMNTMGMTYAEKDFIKAEDELCHLGTKAGDVGLMFLTKSSDVTWTDAARSRLVGDVDHVMASASVQVIEQHNDSSAFFVCVSGWIDFPVESLQRQQFIKEVSDHCSLSVEIKL
jgi:exonuclease III